MAIDYRTYQGYSDPKADRSILLDSMGRRRTESLFKEATQTDNYAPIYTLRETEVDDLPSAYQIYMHSVDETDAALKLVGSLYHWRRLCTAKWFMEGDEKYGFEGLMQWREDMKARDASQARASLQRSMHEGNTAAAKAVLSEATKAPVGRPATKQKNTADKERAAQVLSLRQRLAKDK